MNSNHHWAATVALESIAPGKYVRHQVEGLDLLICRVGDDVRVIENLCSHLLQPLNGGRLSGSKFTCPVHGGVFDISSGAALKFPAGRSIRIFRSQLVDGIVHVDLGETQAGDAKSGD